MNDPEGKCPLCGQSNHCGAPTATEKRCWCLQESIPATLIARVPPALQGKSCICRSCIIRFHQAETDNATPAPTIRERPL